MKSLLWKSVSIHIETIHTEIETNYHNKSFAPRLALKERLRGTRKWPIAPQITVSLRTPLQKGHLCSIEISISPDKILMYVLKIEIV